MWQFKVLNSREKKEIFRMLEEQFGVTDKLDHVFLENNKEKIFIVSPAFGKINEKELRINNVGMYFAAREKDGLRLSIEGSQVVKAKKNLVDVDKVQAHQWLKGEDIAIEGNNGYVLVRYKKDMLGCGHIKNNVLKNMVPKERWLHSITE